MTSRRARRVVYIAGAVLAAVLAGFLFSSGSLITQYHVLLLQRNESYLEELLRGDPHELERAAIEKYLRGAQGREHIVKLFLDAIEEKTRDARSRIDLKFNGQPRVSGVLILENSYLCVFQYASASGAAGDVLRDGKDDRLIRAIAPYLHSLPAEPFTVEEYPGHEISVLPGDQVCSKAGIYCRLVDGRIMKTGTTSEPIRPNWVTDDDVKKLAKGVGLVLRRVEGDLTESRHRR